MVQHRCWHQPTEFAHRGADAMTSALLLPALLRRNRSPIVVEHCPACCSRWRHRACDADGHRDDRGDAVPCRSCRRSHHPKALDCPELASCCRAQPASRECHRRADPVPRQPVAWRWIGHCSVTMAMSTCARRRSHLCPHCARDAACAQRIRSSCAVRLAHAAVGSPALPAAFADCLTVDRSLADCPIAPVARTTRHCCCRACFDCCDRRDVRPVAATTDDHANCPEAAVELRFASAPPSLAHSQQAWPQEIQTIAPSIRAALAPQLGRQRVAQLVLRPVQVRAWEQDRPGGSALPQAYPEY